MADFIYGGCPKMLKSQFIKVFVAYFCFLALIAQASSQNNKVMGEVRFEGDTKVERDSGVWVDGGYVGYVNELKGNKRVLLLPGEHEIVVRQSGYDDFVQKIVVEPGQATTIRVVMRLSPKAQAPDVTATLKLRSHRKLT
jgi:hypothetical protein